MQQSYRALRNSNSNNKFLHLASVFDFEHSAQLAALYKYIKK